MGGSKTKVYFDVSTDSQRIMPDNTLYNAIVKQNLSHLYQDNYNLRKIQTGYYNTSAAQMLNYYNFSKWYSPDRLPTCYIYGLTIPEDAIINYLCSKHGQERPDFIKIFIDYSIVKIIDWIKYFLSSFYNYSLDNQTILYNDKYYVYNGYTYINADVLHCHLKGISSIIITTKHLTYYTTVNHTDTTDYQYTTVYEDIWYTEAGTNRFIKNESTEISHTGTEVPIGTGINDVVTTIISQETLENYSTDINLQIPNIDSSEGYTVKYTFEESEVDYIWVYYPHLGRDDSINQVYIPTITGPVGTNTSLDAMPITVLRTNYFNINEYNKATPRLIPAGDSWLIAHRPPELNAKRCEEIDWILNSINLNLKEILDGFSQNPDEQYLSEAFLLFAIVPNDRYNITSKLLFETFNYLYTDVGLGLTEEKSFYFHEMPFNVEFKWKTYNKNTLNEVIGPIGTYSHNIAKDNNRIDKYYVRTTYKTIGKFRWVKPKDEPKYKKVLTWIYFYEEKEVYYNYPYKCHCVQYDSKDKCIKKKCDYEKTFSHEVIINKRFLGEFKNSVYVKPDIELSYSEELIETTGGTNDYIITINKQISENTCEQIILRGFTGYSSVGRSGYSKRVSAGIDVDNLTIPILIPVLDKCTPMEKIEVMERTLRFVLYTARLHVVKLKWYQTGIFKVFMVVIAIAISIISIGFDGGFTAANILSAVSSMFVGMAIGIGVQLALKLVMDIVNIPWLRQVLMVAVVIAGIVANSYFLDLSTLSTTFLTAEQLLNVSSMIIGDITETKTKQLQNQIINFSQKYENKLNEFEKQLEQLNSGLSTELIYNSIGGGINKNSEDVVTYINPATYYSNALDSCYNFDLLFQDRYDTLIEADTLQFFNN